MEGRTGEYVDGCVRLRVVVCIDGQEVVLMDRRILWTDDYFIECRNLYIAHETPLYHNPTIHR